MICKKCGRTIPDNSKFCTFCGAPVQIETEAPHIPEQPAAPAVPPYPSDAEPHSAPYAPPQGAQYAQRSAPAAQPVYAEVTVANGFALAGFVCSLVGIVVPVFGTVLEIIAFVFSCIGVGQAKKRGEKGRGLAIAGIVISLIVLIVSVLFFLFMASVINSVMTDFYDQFLDLVPYFS